MTAKSPRIGSAVMETVVRLARLGMPPREIAARNGWSTNTVGCHLKQARQAGIDIPRFAPGSGGARRVTVSMPAALRVRLQEPAARRGILTDELAERLLAACLDGDLIDAVLDDAEELADG